MGSSKDYRDYILDQLSGLDDIVCRAMMGEYIIYYHGKIAAYICDNRLLVKQLAAARSLLPDAIPEPPYAGAKDMLPVEQVDDSEFLQRLFDAMYDELPDPKPKKDKR